MRQDKLFYESSMSALGVAITESGMTIKQVACGMWPDMKPDSASSKLSNCITYNKGEKLSVDEAIAISKIIGRWDLLYFIADEAQHTRGEPRAPEDEAAELKRQFIMATKNMERMAQRLEKLGAM